MKKLIKQGRFFYLNIISFKQYFLIVEELELEEVSEKEDKYKIVDKLLRKSSKSII